MSATIGELLNGTTGKDEDMTLDDLIGAVEHGEVDLSAGTTGEEETENMADETEETTQTQTIDARQALAGLSDEALQQLLALVSAPRPIAQSAPQTAGREDYQRLVFMNGKKLSFEQFCRTVATDSRHSKAARCAALAWAYEDDLTRNGKSLIGAIDKIMQAATGASSFQQVRGALVNKGLWVADQGRTRQGRPAKSQTAAEHDVAELLRSLGR